MLPGHLHILLTTAREECVSIVNTKLTVIAQILIV